MNENYNFFPEMGLFGQNKKELHMSSLREQDICEPMLTSITPPLI